MIDHQLILTYAVGCFLLQLVFSFLAPLVVPNFKSFNINNKRNTSNKLVATTHAIIVFSRAAYYWAELNPKMFIHVVPSEYQLHTIQIMMGYLMFDTCFEMLNDRDSATLVHHVLGFISHACTIAFDDGSSAFYSMMIYLAELSTPFLHFSWMLNQAGLSVTSLFMTNVQILMATFVACRIVLGPYLLTHFITQYQGPQYLYALNIIIILGFNMLNFYWFVVLSTLMMKKWKAHSAAKYKKDDL